MEVITRSACAHDHQSQKLFYHVCVCVVVGACFCERVRIGSRQAAPCRRIHDTVALGQRRRQPAGQDGGAPQQETSHSHCGLSQSGCGPVGHVLRPSSEDGARNHRLRFRCCSLRRRPRCNKKWIICSPRRPTCLTELHVARQPSMFTSSCQVSVATNAPRFSYDWKKKKNQHTHKSYFFIFHFFKHKYSYERCQ